MDDKYYTLAVISFEGEDTAKEALKVVKRLQKEKKLTIEDVVAARKDNKGKVKLVQGKELTAAKGARRFGVAGLVAGTLLGGPVAGAVLGAALGGFAGSKSDKGFDNKMLLELSEELEEGGSALFALVSDMDADAVDGSMQELGGEMKSFLIAEEGFLALGNVTEDEIIVDVLEDEFEEVDVPDED